MNIDIDVRNVVDFVKFNVPEERRIGVLKAAVELAAVLWGSVPHQEKVFLMLDVPSNPLE